MHAHTAVSQPAEGNRLLRKIKTDCSRYNAAVFVREMMGFGNGVLELSRRGEVMWGESPTDQKLSRGFVSFAVFLYLHIHTEVFNRYRTGLGGGYVRLILQNVI